LAFNRRAFGDHPCIEPSAPSYDALVPRRLIRHTFTAAASLSLVLLLAWAGLWLRRGSEGFYAGNFGAWADETKAHLEHFHPLPTLSLDDRQWHAPGISIGATDTHDVLETGPARMQYIIVAHRLAFPALSALPAAWVVTRLVWGRKRSARGFDMQPVGAGDGR
jgi:hypothetical protein